MIAQKLLKAAGARGIMIATAESCTGGLIAGAMTDIPGSSAVFDRGFVTYSNLAKTEMLGVPTTMITDHGAVSEEVAAAMAKGALDRSQASLAVSVTGMAGPGGTAAKPEGMVCFGLATADRVTTHTKHFGARGRDHVRRATVETALSLCLEAIENV